MNRIRLILSATGIALAGFLLVGGIIALVTFILESWTKFCGRFDSSGEGMLVFMAPFALVGFVVVVVFIYFTMDKELKQ